MTWYKIDDVAKMTGLTKRTLRFYEEIGLVPPPQRSEGRMRLYSDKDLRQIQEVLLAREVLGFSLQELQHFLELTTSIREKSDSLSSDQAMELEQHLHKQIQMLTDKQQRMQTFQEELQDLLDQLRRKKE